MAARPGRLGPGRARPYPITAQTYDLPLSGIHILDLTRIISGPYCTSILADMGAEVIKIETPGEGDPVRRQGVVRNGLSWYFANYNRNKKSVALNLYSKEGKDSRRPT